MGLHAPEVQDKSLNGIGELQGPHSSGGNEGEMLLHRSGSQEAWVCWPLPQRQVTPALNRSSAMTCPVAACFSAVYPQIQRPCSPLALSRSQAGVPQVIFHSQMASSQPSLSSKEVPQAPSPPSYLQSYSDQGWLLPGTPQLLMGKTAPLHSR